MDPTTLLLLLFAAVGIVVLKWSQRFNEPTSTESNPPARGRRFPGNHGKEWTRSDQRKLGTLYKERVPISEIAHRMGRTQEAVKRELQRIGHRL